MAKNNTTAVTTALIRLTELEISDKLDSTRRSRVNEGLRSRCLRGHWGLTDRMLKLKRLIRAGGCKHAVAMDYSRGQAVTGYVPGGISAIAQEHSHRVILNHCGQI